MEKEKKTLSKKTIGIIIGVAVAVIALGAVVFLGKNRDFGRKVCECDYGLRIQRRGQRRRRNV